MKGSNAMNYLFHYLDENIFDDAMKTYFEKWKFKHPYPTDLQKILEEKSGKNLDWFFTGINKNADKSDYKIVYFKKNKKTNQSELVIKNNGQNISPLNFALLKDDKISDSISCDGFTGKKLFTITNTDCDKVAIDPEKYMFELKRTNNYSRTKGILKKTEPLELRFLGILENPERTQLFFTPVIGWNSSDGVLPGLLFYNPIMPERPFQYRLMPMFGTTSGKIAGTGYAEYKWYPSVLNLQNITLFTDYNRFQTGIDKWLTSWQKYEGGVRFLLKRNASRPLQRWIAEIKTTRATDLYDEDKENQFVNAFVLYKSHSKTMPFLYEVNVESGPEYTKGWTNCTWQINYKNRKTGFRAQFFAGTFFYNKSNNGIYNFHLSGKNGTFPNAISNDYTYSEVFPDRSGILSSDNIWQHQFVKSEGGFNLYVPISSNTWMSSLNLEAAFPIPVPLSVYANIAAYQESDFIPWEAGIELRIIPDIFVVYFPVFISNMIKSTYGFDSKTYTEKIRFTLNFSKLIPFKYTNEIPMMF
jgi:hypothetical protein